MSDSSGSVCVCVCVRQRERERGGILSLNNTTYGYSASVNLDYYAEENHREKHNYAIVRIINLNVY